MKKIQLILAFLALGGSQVANSQTAKLQAIHNSPHPTAASVDVWVSSSLGSLKLLSGFNFREATGFVDVPAGIPVTVAVALPGSSTINDTVPGLSITATLTNNERYVLMASGNVSTSGYAPNPNSLNTSFEFIPVGGIREFTSNGNEIDFKVIHGSTDAPAVDIYARGIATPLISNLAYTSASSYINVPQDLYILDITVAGSSTPVFSKVADLNGLAGNVLTVFASGYLSPENNQDGPSFGIFVALNNGNVIELEDYKPKAKVQVIHNSADPAANKVDVYLNGELLLDDFEFRNATGFVEVDANTDISIGIAPSTSSSADDILADFTYQLEENENYILVANGVLNPASFKANPDSENTAFNLFVYSGAKIAADAQDKVGLLAFHGATDVFTVDVLTGETVLVDNLKYGDFAGYLSVDPQSYMLDITTADNNETVLLRYQADLTGLGGNTALVFASGFLTPSENQNGPAFGFYAALNNGTVVMLPAQELSSVKSIMLSNSSVFPNPTAGNVTIDTDMFNEAKYTIYSVSGSVVSEGNWSVLNNTISTSNLVNGTYYVKLTDSQNVSAFAKIQVLK
jgi:hypothetical protein